MPLESVGRRIDHNAETSESFLSYIEERAKNLQRMLEKMKRKSPAVPLGREFGSGTLERVLGELNRMHESECIQLHGRASALDIRLRQQLAMARDNAIGCGSDYEAELHKYEKETAKARDKLQRSK